VTPPLAIFGLDVGELVEDAVRALVDLIVPDFGAQWVSSLVTWLVALPPVTTNAFPSLNHYAQELTAVGFGLLGACFLGGLLQLWAGGSSGATGAEAVRRAAIGAGALATYTTVLQSLLVGVNILTASMIRHPLVVDGLDKAFGESLAVAALVSGVSLGLAVGAALAVLYFVAALFVLKIGLTALLAVAVVSGALVWGVYPLPQAQWLTRAWLSGLAAALAVPVAWACIFAAAALLARDTLVFESGGRINGPLADPLGNLVKPFAAVACFWIAYRAPYFLLGVARTAGLASTLARPGGRSSSGQSAASRGAQTPAERFRAFLVTPRPGAVGGAARSSGSRGSAPTRARARQRSGGSAASPGQQRASRTTSVFASAAPGRGTSAAPPASAARRGSSGAEAAGGSQPRRESAHSTTAEAAARGADEKPSSTRRSSGPTRASSTPAAASKRSASPTRSGSTAKTPGNPPPGTPGPGAAASRAGSSGGRSADAPRPKPSGPAPPPKPHSQRGPRKSSAPRSDPPTDDREPPRRPA
jgi:hypothetical protein